MRRGNEPTIYSGSMRWEESHPSSMQVSQLDPSPKALCTSGCSKDRLQIPWSEGHEEVFVAVALLPVLLPDLLQHRHPALLLLVGMGLALSGPFGVGLLWWPSRHRSYSKLCVTRDAKHIGKGGQLGQEWLWGCAHKQDVSWVTGPGSRRGRRLGTPHVSVFVGNELMCAKFHHTHLTYLREYHKDLVLNASRALLAFIHGNMKFHSNLWYTSPLPHYLKCGFALKTACIKLASASLTDIFHVWNQNTGLVPSMARIFFHVLLFCVGGREAALHFWISGNSSIALPF